MKIYVETKEMTQAEAEAGQTKTRRLATANQVFQIPQDRWNMACYPHTPLRIEKGLLARGYNFLVDYNRRGVGADVQPSVRLGVLYVDDEKPHTHKFLAQPKKCKCGKLRA